MFNKVKVGQVSDAYPQRLREGKLPVGTEATIPVEDISPHVLSLR